jgi:hypothetical protein
LTSPDPCKYPDQLCTECTIRASCGPLDEMLQEPIMGGRVKRPGLALTLAAQDKPVSPRPRRKLPDFLRGASKSVKESYGY